jgi:hypothetical protein
MDQKQKDKLIPKRSATAPSIGHPLPRVRTLFTYLALASGIGLALTLGGWLLGALLKWAGELIGLPIALGSPCLVVLVVSLVAQGTARKDIARMLADRQATHWTYDEREWLEFATRSWRRNIRSALIVTVVVLGVTLVFDLAILGNKQEHPDALLILIITVGIPAAVGLLLLLRAALILRSRRQSSTREVYISQVGVILGGWYTSLSGLRRVSYAEGDPGVLRFVSGAGRSTQVIEAPVPRGRETEAIHLTQSLRSK